MTARKKIGVSFILFPIAHVGQHLDGYCQPGHVAEQYLGEDEGTHPVRRGRVVYETKDVFDAGDIFRECGRRLL